MSGYHAVAVQGRMDAADLIRAVYGPGVRTTPSAAGPGEFPGRDTTAGTAIVGEAAGWTIVCGGYPPDMVTDDEAARLADLSHGRTVLRWATESVTGAEALDLFAGGELRRRFWQMEGEVTGSEGDPVDGEPPGGLDQLEPWDVDEWKLVDVVEAHVAPWDELAEADYTRYAF